MVFFLYFQKPVPSTHIRNDFRFVSRKSFGYVKNKQLDMVGQYLAELDFTFVFCNLPNIEKY